jgi:8-oxo-dGTP pyrophosphatase MutT (NUDIX family)
MIQGGSWITEIPKQTAHREAKEEANLVAGQGGFEIITMLAHPRSYFFERRRGPRDKYDGEIQYPFVGMAPEAALRIMNDHIIDRQWSKQRVEFTSFSWHAAADVMNLVTGPRREVYEKILEEAELVVAANRARLRASFARPLTV